MGLEGSIGKSRVRKTQNQSSSLKKKLCKPIDEAIFHICAKFDAHKFDLKNQKVKK
jgi:hypothetical protein